MRRRWRLQHQSVHLLPIHLPLRLALRENAPVGVAPCGTVLKIESELEVDIAENGLKRLRVFEEAITPRLTLRWKLKMSW
jgi:hypothetical protein